MRKKNLEDYFDQKYFSKTFIILLMNKKNNGA